MISAFLFHRGDHDDPERLAANSGKSFQGSIVLGMGFTFDDTDKKGVATPLSEMRRLTENFPSNKDAIFPYIGGQEVNTSPTHSHHRFVIDFGERDEIDCRRDWPGLFDIVRTKRKTGANYRKTLKSIREWCWSGGSIGIRGRSYGQPSLGWIGCW